MELRITFQKGSIVNQNLQCLPPMNLGGMSHIPV